jgi:hypothetical protein
MDNTDYTDPALISVKSVASVVLFNPRCVELEEISVEADLLIIFGSNEVFLCQIAIEMSSVSTQ